METDRNFLALQTELKVASVRVNDSSLICWVRIGGIAGMRR